MPLRVGLAGVVQGTDSHLSELPEDSEGYHGIEEEEDEGGHHYTTYRAWVGTASTGEPSARGGRWTPPNSSFQIVPGLESEAAVPEEFEASLMSLEEAETWVKAHPTTWVVDQLIQTGSVNLISADSKAGKSTFLRSLALAVLRGDPFLGRESRSGSVIYYCLEDRINVLVKFLRQHGIQSGANLTIVRALPDAFFPHGGEYHLRRAMRRTKPDLVIIDMLADLFPIEDINDYIEVGKVFMGTYRFLVNELPQSAIIASQHMRKPGTHDRGSLPQHRVLGSAALQGKPYTAFLIDINSRKERFVETLQREGEPLERTRLMMCPVTGLVSLAPPVEPSAEAPNLQGLPLGRMAQVYEALRELEGVEIRPYSIPEICDRAGVHPNNYSKALYLLASYGYLKRVGSGARGSRFRYQSVPENFFSATNVLKEGLPDKRKAGGTGEGGKGKVESAPPGRGSAIARRLGDRIK